MCGIVGLLVKTPALRERLGELMMPMLIGMTERGPDSAGLAVFTEPLAGALRQYSIHSGLLEGGERFDWNALAGELQRHSDSRVAVEAKGNHGVVKAAIAPALFKEWLAANHPGLFLLSAGRSIELYKDTGTPAEVAERYRFGALKGTHLVAHTRMATESAVTPDRAHPFTAGEDFCLVHNGSLSNPNAIRRKLQPLGIHFETDNDTEAACRFIEWRMREGDDLERALQAAFNELDGFYTLLMGTAD
jgi:amidophosphoribosyltransferase